MDRGGETNYPNAVYRRQGSRLLAANLPSPLLAQVYTAIAEEPTWELADAVDGNLATLLAAMADIDLVVLGARAARPLPGIGTHLFYEFPHLKLIVVSLDGREACLYWLNLEQLSRPVGSVIELQQAIQLALHLDPGF
jgi:hypothetical protein